MPRMGGYVPADHKTRHQDGGRDEISIASLSGTPADLTTHAALTNIHKIARGRAKSATVTFLTIPGSLNNYPVGANAPGANKQRYEPFEVLTTISIDQLVIEITAAAAGGKKARLAIYRADTDWQPTDLVVDAGEVAVDDTVVSVATLDPVVELIPGRYLAAFITDGTPTLRTINAGSPGGAILTTYGSSPFISFCVVDRTYAAYPDPGTAWDTVLASAYTFQHAILLRVSTP